MERDSEINVIAVFCGHTHENHIFWKVTANNIDTPSDIYRISSPTDEVKIWHNKNTPPYYSPVYIETEKST